MPTGSVPPAPGGVDDEKTVPLAGRREISLACFSRSARGSSHVRCDLPCQDASISRIFSDGALACVSDGHGQSASVRSDRGSKIAVRCAADCLEEFALHAIEPQANATGSSVTEDLLTDTRSAQTVRRLTDAILSRWAQGVREDLAASPFAKEELERAGEGAEALQRGEHLELAYGATLVAALWVGHVLLLLQQGDGRCVVVDGEGRMSQPIPWDPRCHENVTTSLSDVDAVDGIRHAVIDLRATNVAAVLMGSDGVDGSFVGDEGLYDYYRRVLVTLADAGAKGLESQLEKSLPQLSKRGSGDDVSVAGIVRPHLVQPLVQSLRDASEAYELGIRLRDKRAKLVSMQRKHELMGKRAKYLKRRLDGLDRALASERTRYVHLERELSSLDMPGARDLPTFGMIERMHLEYAVGDSLLLIDRLECERAELVAGNRDLGAYDAYHERYVALQREVDDLEQRIGGLADEKREAGDGEGA